MAKKVSQRQIQAEIIPVNSTDSPQFTSFIFPQISGGEITASVEKIYEGGSRSPTVLCAPFEIGDITLTAHYDDGLTESASLAKKLQTMRTLVGRAYYDINVKVYDCDIGVPGTDRVYSKALLVGLTEPDGDSSSGAPATFALTFAIQSVSVPTATVSTPAA
jgi:hypothetical protein